MLVMGRRMKEIQQVDLYDYETMEEIDQADEFQEEEEADDQIKVVKACLYLLLAEESKSTVREEALTTIIKALEHGSPFYNNKIVYNYNVFVVLFMQCMISIEIGSSKEVSLAAHVIGFLALSTAHLGDDEASGILHQSLPLIYKRLKLPISIDHNKTVSLLNCLAIINFVVGSNQEEEPRDVIWRNVTKIIGEAKGSALLAYGFFLTSMNHSMDDRTISYLCSGLDCDESTVRAISAQVLALIFETYGLTDDVREKVLQKVKYLSVEEEGKSQMKVFREVAEFLEHGYFPKGLRNSRKDDLYVQISSWADLMKLKFLKQFLGKKGFSEHMHKNEFLQAAVLKVSSPKESGSERRDQNFIRMGKKLVHRKMLRVLNNKRKILNKQRTGSLKKGRMLKAAVGCYDMGF